MEQNFISPTQQTRTNRSHTLILSLLGLTIATCVAGLVYLWMRQDSLNTQVNTLNTTVSDQKAQVTDREKALSSLPNKVEDAAKSPLDLIVFLGADNTQCYKQQNSGYFKVLAHANDQFAKMQYGCVASGSTTPSGGSPTYILAKKVNDAWQLISPTNQWSYTSTGQGLPSCTMVNDNKVSKLVTPQCFTGEVSSPTVQQVTNL